MATIRYTKTYFNEPDPINKDTFLLLKEQLSRNPNFEIDPNPETFSERFGFTLKIIKICGIGGGIGIFLSLVLSSRAGDWADKIGAKAFMICTIVIIAIGIPLLLEGPSFATYVKRKTEYFSRMKYVIQNTDSYHEFCISFYGK